MRGKRRRGLTFEQVEHRIVLSASTEVLGSDISIQRLGGISQQAVIAADDTTRTANDLGILAGNYSVDDYVGQFDQQDVYRFVLEEDAEVEISLADPAAQASLKILSQDRASLSGTTSDRVWRDDLQTALDAGEYYVMVERDENAPATNYTLDIQATLMPLMAPTDTAGSSFETSLDLGTIAGSAIVNEYVGSADYSDVFEFSVGVDSNVSVSLTGQSGDGELLLFNSNQQEIGASLKDGLEDEVIHKTLAAGESYFVVVIPFESSDSHYTLTVSTDGSGPIPGPPPTNPLTDVPYFGSPTDDWGLNYVNAPEAWANGYTGAGVVVAVVDSGVQIDHPDLVSNIWVNPGEVAGDGIDNDGNGYIDDTHGWDFIDNNKNMKDGNGHGTHVSGTIAGLNDGVGVTGVAYDAEIMAVRVLGDDGSGSYFGVAQGIRYAVDNGADVINLSLGGVYSESVEAALQHARQHDVVVVAAAGNESAAIPGHPAIHSNTLPNTISVGAHDVSGNIASFSNKVGYSGAVQIDGPGVDILSSVPTSQYDVYSGTSMATPHVAGVVALTLSAYPTLTSIQIRNALVLGTTGSIAGSDSIGVVNAAMTIPLSPNVSTQPVVGGGYFDGRRPPADEPAIALGIRQDVAQHDPARRAVTAARFAARANAGANAKNADHRVLDDIFADASFECELG